MAGGVWDNPPATDLCLVVQPYPLATLLSVDSIPVELPMRATSQASAAAEPSDDPISALEQGGGLLSLLAALALAGLVGWRRQRAAAWLALTGAGLAGLAAVAWIFRNPTRRGPADSDLALAPCDGEVIAVAEVQEPRFLKAAAWQITVRVRPSQVQVLRAPVGGIVRTRRYLPAGQEGQRDDALLLGVQQRDGGRVLVRLQASGFWRRLPTYAGRRITLLPDLEDALQPGQVSGHLPLGGLVQIYLPQTSHLAIAQGQHLRGGETILARL